MTNRLIDCGFQDHNKFDVGIAIDKSEIEPIRKEITTWRDRYGNDLFHSQPRIKAHRVAWDVVLEGVVQETTGMPAAIELGSVEELMFFSGLLDKMMRSAGY
ncbi:hypothetical protein B7L88_gp102 [Rhizobium phage RHEph10]|uniref:hypothetical protein n=1 Tax=Rhizobium phage RHEph10 TaxID=1220717 RepID=UPI0002AB6998|nr:hypothetical protein B7L88_gp102 [Rhizobium phage RHEph10]AGC36186.1 hypothetical protein RHEph10_gp143 [Rhizobium phage RHEph10]